VDIGRALVRYTPRSRRILAEIAESAASATLERPVERLDVTEAPRIVAKPRPGRLLVQLIQAGWSLNGRYYPSEVLRRDGPNAWPAGTQCFIDHATEAEDEARPAGSIRNLAATLTQNAYWDDKRQALLAEVRLFAPWREAITDMADSIGMSIRAWVYGEHGEQGGRSGLIVSGIPEGRSVDFVTTPAAGGAILSVLESVTPAAEARNVGAWLESRLHLALTQLGDDMYGQGRLTRDERITLSSAIGDALTSYTARVEADAPQLYKRDLWDEPEPAPAETAETRAPTPEPTAAPVIENVPDGAPPAAPNPPTEEEPVTTGTNTGAQSPGEAGTATTEARTTATEAPAEARVALLEAERDRERQRAQVTAEQLADAQAEARRAAAQAAEALAEMRRLRANEAGRVTVDRLLVADESGVPADLQALIGPRVHAHILNRVPLTDAGEVDQTALEAAATAAIRAERVHAAALLEAQGIGRVAGLGADGDPAMQMTREQFEGGMAGVFKAIGMTDDVAALAAKGR
jgi:hypothetical protein